MTKTKTKTKNKDVFYLIVGIFAVILLFATIELFDNDEYKSTNQLSLVQMQSSGGTEITLDGNLRFIIPAETNSADLAKEFEAKGFDVTTNLLKTKYTATLDKSIDNCEANYKITWTTQTDGGVQNIQSSKTKSCS